MRRRRAGLVAVLTGALLVTGGAVADARPPDRPLETSAVLVVDAPEDSGGAAAVDVLRTTRDAVTARNTAQAAVGCDGCVSAAVSVQLVLAGGAPTDVLAENTAVAMTSGCAACSATAVAVQVVVAVEDRLRMTGQGRHRLEVAERELVEAIEGGADALTTLAAAQAVVDELVAALATELRTTPVVRARYRESQAG